MLAESRCIIPKSPTMLEMFPERILTSEDWGQDPRQIQTRVSMS